MVRVPTLQAAAPDAPTFSGIDPEAQVATSGCGGRAGSAVLSGMSNKIGATVVAGIELSRNQWLSRLEHCFWEEGFRRDVWMIVDAARDRKIVPMLHEFHLEHYCLYSGRIPPAIEAVTPYLVQLDYGDRETRRFLDHAWGNSWGVFLKCATHARTLRRHLREFLVMRDPKGNRLVFRYYDPRVLRVYLPTCNADELEMLFGPIERFWMESNVAGTILDFRLDMTQLIEAKHSLGERLGGAKPSRS